MKTYTIKEIIEELKKYPNQNATINFISNTRCAEDDAFDVDHCQIDFMEQDKDYVDSYDIIIHKENKMHNDESIIELLDEHGKLTIELDVDNPFVNIVVSNENNDVLREICVGGRHEQSVNIGIMLERMI
ncbi:hypothetical protein J6Q66_05250 [bacterium]|nr:hypothetical protein [bacterium]